MAGKIIIDAERCKGCGLCVAVCPEGGIIVSAESNKKGYFPAQAAPKTGEAECTGCALCAIICPEAVIEVHRESRIFAVEAAKEGKSSLDRTKV